MKAPQNRRRCRPVALRGSRRRQLAVSRFATDYVRVPRGPWCPQAVAGSAWQRELIAATWDRRPRLAGWMLPRGQGRTSLTAVLALYELLAGPGPCSSSTARGCRSWSTRSHPAG